jgi:hypothetical protein
MSDLRIVQCPPDENSETVSLKHTSAHKGGTQAGGGAAGGTPRGKGGLSSGVAKSRNALMDAAYDDEEYVDDRTIDSHIKRLRIKFKANDVEFDMVETLYGIGYRFKDV